MSTGFMGKDGLSWFFGVVEDRMDPLEIGRVKVRVFGYHSSNKNELPTETLPWATVLQPTTSANFSGKGLSSVGLLEGTWVFGFFADPGSYQIPVIIGAISGLNSPVIKELKESYGNAFKDNRELGELSNSPSDEIIRDYPDGLFLNGDSHGAFLQTEPRTEKYPTKLYKPGANSKQQGTPDTNILALNDPTRITKTIVDLKTKERSEGGLLDTAIPVADVLIPRFTTGILGPMAGSKVNIGTIKGLGIPSTMGEPPYPPSNAVISSSFSSRKINSRQYKSNPRNSNNELIHTGTGPADILKAAGSKVPSIRSITRIGSSTMQRITNIMDNIVSLPDTLTETAQAEVTQTAGAALGTGGTP